MQNRVVRSLSAVFRLLSSLGMTALCLALSNLTAHAADPNNILLDFSASWCGPCQDMSPIVSKLERLGLPIRKVDIDAEKAFASQFNIEFLPCFVLISNGREVTRVTGRQDEKKLRELMAMLPKPDKPDSSSGLARTNAMQNPVTKSPDEKKPALKVSQLLPNKKKPDLKLTPTDSETVRGQNPSNETTADGFARDPLTTSIRIRVKDGTRLHYGSGTIIESLAGRAIILTCGHIFRDHGKDAIVEVDLFTNGASKPSTIVGQILDYNLKADIGLLTIPTQQRLPVIKLSSVNEPPTVDDRVVSIGCGGGDRPTRQDLVVTAVNKYQGPENVECNGVPQQGRSGGGLFLGSQLIGVCIAADPKEKRGIYTAMKPVAQLLEKVKLGYLVPGSSMLDQSMVQTPPSASGASLGNAVGVDDPAQRTDEEEMASSDNIPPRASSNVDLGSQDYIGAEIVCIVHSKKPGALKRIVIINQASTRFVNDLLHESGTGGQSERTVAIPKDGATEDRKPKMLGDKCPVKRKAASASNVAMQKPAVNPAKTSDSERPIETSFEPQRYRRNRNN